MQEAQKIFDNLAFQQRATIMQLRRERNQAGLHELQEKMAAEAMAQAKANGPVLTDEQKKVYSTIGGTPHLDNQYTVFGEVEEGLDVVEQIQQTATGRNDRPQEDVIMTMTMVE